MEGGDKKKIVATERNVKQLERERERERGTVENERSGEKGDELAKRAAKVLNKQKGRVEF